MNSFKRTTNFIHCILLDMIFKSDFKNLEPKLVLLGRLKNINIISNVNIFYQNYQYLRTMHF